MTTPTEQIEAIEKEIRETPYHKGTERHIGILRAKIAILKDKVLESQTRKSGGGGGYSVKKQGDATVVLVGPPSAGKSTLINKFTNSQSRVAPYAFTTVSVIPGMMKYQGAYIQILDVPGLIEGAEEGKGRGREVLSVVRGADLLIIISDIKRPNALKTITEALERNGIRINKTSPDVVVDKKLSGGITIHTNLTHEMSKETIKDIAMQMGIKSALIAVQEKLTMERLTDAFSRNRVYIPALYVLNKSDIGDLPESDYKILPISAEKDINLELLKEKIWEKLDFATIYLVKPGEEPNNNNPLVVKNGILLSEVTEILGSDFAETKTKAKLWGPGAKFPGQEVSLNTRIKNQMQVKFI